MWGEGFAAKLAMIARRPDSKVRPGLEIEFSFRTGSYNIAGPSVVGNGITGCQVSSWGHGLA